MQVFSMIMTVMLVNLCFAVSIALAQYECSVPKEVPEHTIGEIVVEHVDYDFIRINIHKTQGDFLSKDKLNVLRLQDKQVEELVYRQYGFTGPPGDYIVYIEMFSRERGFADEQYEFKIVASDEPEPTPPGPGPGPDPTPPGPGPDDFDGLYGKLVASQKGSMAAEYASAVQNIAMEIDSFDILRVSDAAKEFRAVMETYRTRGWSEFNKVILEDSSKRPSMTLGEVKRYYEIISQAIRSN